ncbi:MAG: GerMN domain-containing protein [Desulfobacter sp.]|nr:MAG: GerMN domain-containing protein [Desulfobacter sp.]
MENNARLNTGRIPLIRIFVMGIALLTVLAPVWCPAQQEDAPVDRALFDAFLYFTGPGGSHLTAENRHFPAATDAHQMGRNLLEALAAGPSQPGLQSVLPQGTRLGALFITGRGEAYVDLAMETAGRTDALSEYLAVYAVVNTLSVNIPEIKRVKILVNGSEAASLGGHISLSPFFKTNMLIVK